MTADPTAPDPGPQPQAERLNSDEIEAKYGADLTDDAILQMLIRERRLSVAGDRKTAKEQADNDAWQKAYMKRYGTDEG